MNCIKRFQNTQDVSLSVVNSYSDDQFMHVFLDKYFQGVKYTTQIKIH